jgi:hypothetical protein
VEDRLDSPALRGLPPEAREYLEILAEAFRRQDRDFILAQGEAHYDSSIRPYYDEGQYLAMLYRSGPYSGEGAGYSPGDGEFPQLNPGVIRGIEYLSWEEQGPLLEIRGRLLSGADAIPCVIRLVWKLREPKIQGIYP